MLVNEDIICFSSIDWDFNWQGHQEIMQSLAASGNRVLFIENTGVRIPRLRDYKRLVNRFRNWRLGYKGIRRVDKNLFVFSPIILPFPYSRMARWINKRLILKVLNSWCKAQKCASPILWAFLPSSLTLELIQNLSYKLLIYYCIDSFEHSSPAASKIAKSERRIIHLADLVFVTSELLREHCAPHNKEVHKFPFTVNYDRFRQARESELKDAPDDLLPISPPRVAYIGGLHRWCDQELVVQLSKLLPEVSFVFVGPEQEPVQTLRELPNVHLLGGKPHRMLPYYLRYMDIGLIPYRITDYTDNVYPTKLNEYLAMGIPVVSTPIREVVWFNGEHPGMVDICEDAQAMARVIKQRLASAGSPEEEEARARRIELAKANSWPVRIEMMCKLIQTKISQLKKVEESRWRDRMAETFAAHRKKVITVAAAVLLLYAALYWSPLVYILGRPLWIENPPAPSDVILVFGGGVGETGRPGTSTLERAGLAVKLYNKGLAGKIIFSSGFQQFNNLDAENMQRVAIGEGLPAENILVEDRSRNNYENVRNCLDLMSKHGYTSALVISSRYNMLRTKLLFHRQLEFFPSSGITPDSIHLVPVVDNIFFDPGQGDRLAQIRAIFHEYAAIIDYWWLDRL
ncbi:MAG TPA: ElyC/SanA/YdcF family protein [archaeon]|nr:ElyC/SanA/YdcF family protein [archaeon]